LLVLGGFSPGFLRWVYPKKPTGARVSERWMPSGQETEQAYSTALKTRYISFHQTRRL